MKKAYEIIADPFNWIVGHMTFNKWYTPDRNAVQLPIKCFCAVGAIREKYNLNNENIEAINAHQEYQADIKIVAAKLTFSGHSGGRFDPEDIIVSWNDHAYRKHSEVVGLLKECDV